MKITGGLPMPEDLVYETFVFDSVLEPYLKRREEERLMARQEYEILTDAVMRYRSPEKIIEEIFPNRPKYVRHYIEGEQ